MIETKEQYERAKIVAETQSGPTLREAMETIEALRKVVRRYSPFANSERDSRLLYTIAMFVEVEDKTERGRRRAMWLRDLADMITDTDDGLPDWLTDD